MSLLSDLSDLFSIRRREACIPNSIVKVSADGRNRSRRRSLSVKYQTLFSNISHDCKSAEDPNIGSKQAANRTFLTTSTVPDVPPTVSDVVSPLADIGPQESNEPAENPDTPEKPRLRRRPKTPIRRVGQLEEGCLERDIKRCSKALAEEYQAVLEPRTAIQSPTTSRSLRKIGGRHDLRRTSLDSSCDSPTSPDFSDVDTIVGSDRSSRPSTKKLRLDSDNSFCSSGSSWSTSSASSYYSAMSEKPFGLPEKRGYALPRNVPEMSTKSVQAAQNIEMKICLDLLKQDLSSALSPCNLSDSTFGVQLWLMIESYESMKRRLRQQLSSQTMLGCNETPKLTFQVLDHWLEALYSVYNSLLQDIPPMWEQDQTVAKSEALSENECPVLCVGES